MGCHRAEKFNGVAAGHAKPAELGCGGSESLEREGTGAMDQEIRKPRVKLVKIGDSFRDDGAWRTFFGDSKGRLYLRSRRKGWREVWHYVTTIYDGRK